VVKKGEVDARAITTKDTPGKVEAESSELLKESISAEPEASFSRQEF
jgi:hypothetical protein